MRSGDDTIITMSDIPGWHSPEYGSGVGLPVRPFWIPNPSNDDLTPRDSDDPKPKGTALANVAKETLQNAVVGTTGDEGYDLNTILVGGAVVIAALILLTGGKGK